MRFSLENLIFLNIEELSMNYGFFRVAAASPSVIVADCDYNICEIKKYIENADKKGTELIVFPELCITGYTCSDLFFQTQLIQSAKDALCNLAEETKDLDILYAVGLPIHYRNSLYNCAAFVKKGRILALIPKTNIPNYSEFYEVRNFTSAASMGETGIDFVTLSEKQKDIPFGTDIIIYDDKDSSIAVAAEICEDIWVPCPPSTRHAIAGATIIANLSASNEIIGKSDYRRMLIQSHSGRLSSAYIYADAGSGESTTDLVFAADNFIAENGSILAHSEKFGDGFIIHDVDTEKLMQQRRRQNTYPDFTKAGYKRIFVSLQKETKDLIRNIECRPFVPDSEEERNSRCKEILTLQAEGLAKRLRHTNAKSAVIGLSGGLDSTLALLVTAEAFRLAKLELSGIIAVTMPGFGTTDRTYTNATILAKESGAALLEVSIKDAVIQHFKDISHDINVHDVTYENSQARERTQILMDIANKNGGLVIGTGDLSELALGWATYNGDHMSMYGVNASIPKTLVRYLVKWAADRENKLGNSKLAAVLEDVLDTPVSPELLPPDNGNISQKTEELVGPYELHDFFLYYMLRWGFSPAKIFFLAEKAFNGKYAEQEILKWLKNFYRRFFAQQFKRSCLPDGAKVGTVSLSPRGDWRMPSDASCAVWMKEVDML